MNQPFNVIFLGLIWSCNDRINPCFSVMECSTAHGPLMEVTPWASRAPRGNREGSVINIGALCIANSLAPDSIDTIYILIIQSKLAYPPPSLLMIFTIA